MENKKRLIFTIIWLTAGMYLVSCKPGQQTSMNEGQKANVLFINVDDLGWKDVGFMGSKWFETPNLDQLASEGMVFTQAYATASNCAPSRACLMTGQYSPRHGVYTVGDPARGNERTRKLIPAPNVEDLDEQLLTMGKMFQNAGYVTGTFGKWHLGPEPLNQGFDVNVAGGRDGNPHKNGYFSPYSVPNIEDGPEGEYLTDRLTDEAIRFIRNNKDKKFFAYVPFYIVHTPLDPKKELYEKYKEKKGILSDKQAKYAAMVEAMDTNVGRLLNALDEMGLSDNTMVIFTSDNGGIRAISPLDPLRAGKGSYFEGGIRIPLAIRWPGKVEPGTKSTFLTTNIDFFPTFKDILDIKVDTQLDGQSLLPVLSGEEVNAERSERSLYWHFPVYLQGYSAHFDDARDPLFRTRPGSVIRKGKWKLHEYFEDNKLLLYDLENDLGETSNVADEHPEVVEELYGLLKDWRRKLNAPDDLSPNPEYDPKFESNKLTEILSRQ
jgi:arylsulfatase A-like enzyme